ncbi:hypothetical protein B0J18DRAFT_414168 [Chaetomium sp. MPI-SDFR-AT-0129]|nr:hypothetical protein B0J18DRAFT_414168 [Chaetomium sp. MPI-SDFR-AT-0129]
MSTTASNTGEHVEKTTVDSNINSVAGQSAVDSSATELNAADMAATEAIMAMAVDNTNNVANTNAVENTTAAENTNNMANASNSVHGNTTGNGKTLIPPVFPSSAFATSVAAELAKLTKPELKAVSDVMVDFGMLTTEMVGAVGITTPDELTASGLITPQIVANAMMIAGVGPYAGNPGTYAANAATYAANTGKQAAPELPASQPAAVVPGPATAGPSTAGPSTAGPAKAKTGVASGRVTKKKNVATPTKLSAKANSYIDNAVNNSGDSGPSTPTNTTPGLLIGKASGPTCINCRKNKARCDRIVTCAKCAKAGVDCEINKGKGIDGSHMKPSDGPLKLKACDRCRRMKSACVRRDKCVRCDKRGEECVVG